MKTLYETILGSTNSGKFKTINTAYLLSHDFVPETRYGNAKDTYMHKEYEFDLRVKKNRSGKEFVLLDFENSNHKVVTKIVSNIAELDIVLHWWKELNNNPVILKEVTKWRDKIEDELEELE